MTKSRAPRIDPQVRAAVEAAIPRNPGDWVTIDRRSPRAVTATLWHGTTATEYVFFVRPNTHEIDHRRRLDLGLDGQVIKAMLTALAKGGPEELLRAAGALAKDARTKKEEWRRTRNLCVIALREKYGWSGYGSLIRIREAVGLDSIEVREILQKIEFSHGELPVYPDGQACAEQARAANDAYWRHRTAEETAVRMRDPLVLDFVQGLYGEHRPGEVAKLASITPARVTQLVGGDAVKERRKEALRARSGGYRPTRTAGVRVVMLPLLERATTRQALLTSDEAVRELLGGESSTVVPLRPAEDDAPALDLISVPDKTRPLNRLASAAAVQFGCRARVHGTAVLAAWDQHGEPTDVPDDVVRHMVAAE